MKKTKKEYFNELMTYVSDNEDLMAFIQHELEMLDKKKTSGKNNAKVQENTALKEKIYNLLCAEDRALTITEMVKLLDEEVSNQRVSALVKQLKDAGKVERTMNKKTALFKAVK